MMYRIAPALALFMAAPAAAQAWEPVPSMAEGWFKRDLGREGCTIADMTDHRSFGYMRARRPDAMLETVAFSPNDWPEGDEATFPGVLVIDGREIAVTLTRIGGMWELDLKWREETARHPRFELRLTGVPGVKPFVVDSTQADRAAALAQVKAC